MKKLIAGLVCGAVMLAGFLPAAFAVSSASVSMQASAEQAAATLNLSNSAQEITAVSLSFQVNVTSGTSDKTSVWFAFDNSLPANIQEYRYNASTGRLTLYLSGKDALFKENSSLLGSIKASSQEGGVTLSVEPIADSLKLVNTAHETMNAPTMDGSGAVELVVGDGGENAKPKVDFTALTNAIASAESKDASQYTTESWNALQAALRSAKAVLASADSTQESVDSATNALNAAIHGLVSVNNGSGSSSSAPTTPTNPTNPTTPTNPSTGGNQIATVTTSAAKPSASSKKPTSSSSSSSSSDASGSSQSTASSSKKPASSSAASSETGASSQNTANNETKPKNNDAIVNTIMMVVSGLLVIAIIGIGIAIVIARKRRS